MTLVIIFIPLLIYLYAALKVEKVPIKHPDDFFAAFRRVGQTEFTSSSIAYGFQVSTIYPFLFWGASLFLFVPFVNSIAWGVGILLFYLSFNRISKFLGTSKTIHGLLGEIYGESIRKVASCLTIVGFMGYIISELWFGSRVFLSILPNSGFLLYGVVFVFIGFITLYLFKNGQISSFITDQLQLLFTYIGVFGIIIYLLYMVVKSDISISPTLNWGLLLFLAFIPIILVVRKMSFIKTGTYFDKYLNFGLVFLFVIIFGLSLTTFFSGSQNLALTDFINLEGFGLAGLISLIILPLGWQFVDLTNWQRLLAVGGGDSKLSTQYIKKGLVNFSLESPFTWLLFLVFGLLINTVFSGYDFQDVLIDFPRELINSESSLENVLGYGFVISIISIMLSTVDSFFMGISFTYVYDINRRSRYLLENIEGEKDVKEVLLKGKVFSTVAVVLSFCLFVFFDRNVDGGGELFINLLMTFYSATLALLPLVLGLLFLNRRPNETWSMLSVLIGAGAGVSVGVYSVLYNPNLAWYPIIISTTLSGCIYAIGLFFKNRVTHLHLKHLVFFKLMCSL